MKKILVLFLVLVARLCAQSETLDLNSHGKITFFLGDGWKVDVGDFGARQIVTITPKDEAVNATCTLTVTFPERDRYDSKSRLKLRVEADGERMAESSVERRAVARELGLRAGYGYICNFTDPDLVGKPPQIGNYKVISAGLIRFAPDVLVEVGISADGFKTEPYQELLGAIEGMEFEPPKEK